MVDSQRDAEGTDTAWCRARRVAALLGLAGMILACGGVGCGGRPPAAKPTTPAPAGDAGQGPVVSGEEPAARDPAVQPAGPDSSGDGAASAVTEAECQALLAHVVAVAHAAHVQTVAPEHAPTEDQLAEIRARMAPEFVPVCLSLDRATVTCQMRASTRDELLACMPP